MQICGKPFGGQFLDVSHFQGFEILNPVNVREGTHIAIARRGEDVAGLARLYAFPSLQVHISFLEVAKHHRGHKVGRAVLRGIFEYASSLTHQGKSSDDKPCVTVQGATG